MSMMKSLDPVGYAESGRMLRVHVALLHPGAMWVRWMTYIEVAIACFLIKCMAAQRFKIRYSMLFGWSTRYATPALYCVIMYCIH